MLEVSNALHLANRLGFGPAPGQLDHIRQLGTSDYIEEQLKAQLRPPETLQQLLNGLPSFGKSTFELYRDNWWKARAVMGSRQNASRAEKKQYKKLFKVMTREVGPEVRMARIARAIANPNQLQEALVDFWFNHFNVYEKKNLVKIWVGAFEEEAIRPHIFGKFGDLLLATAKHPAMLVYLDNWRNSAPGVALGHGKQKDTGINENYAREVMELHTLGADGGYTQSDVTALAHILTGWTVGAEGEFAQDERDDAPDDEHRIRGGFRFAARRHDSSPQIFLGKRYTGAGAGEGEEALLALARHPSTARHISFKLAQYFVADQPPELLVSYLASVFSKTDGDLRAVLRDLLTSNAFLDPANAGRKFKTPYRYVVSMARAVGMDPRKAAPLAEELKELGQPIYECVTPDGYACTESAWLDPDAMTRRISFAVKFGSGAYLQDYLADIGYGRMSKRTHLQPEGDGGTPLDPDKLLAVSGIALGAASRAAIAKAPRSEQAGLILGSPEFMRC